ncbi:MAG: DUF1489 domain-containing protein [Rhodospirillales bacterium]|nr:DUF1489 domain-containing protein [Rhodospirillales bacterium]
MTVHLIKLAVGVEDVDHLAGLQAERLRKSGRLHHITRHAPKRADEVLAGGSLYWVIRGFVRVRQSILGFDKAVKSDGRPACAVILDPKLIATELRTFRPFQGWRYFDPVKAPPDLKPIELNETRPPPEMEEELRELGLL